LSKDLAIVTCTDGKVRGLLAGQGGAAADVSGRQGVLRAAGSVGDTAYVADLEGVVHAINVKTGASR